MNGMFHLRQLELKGFERTYLDVLVSTPNIRDGKGRLIMPHEYRLKLKDRSVVMVNAFLKLYVYFNFVSKVFNGINYECIECRIVEDNGNRIYKVVLNSMQSYPVANIIEIVYGVSAL